MHQLVNILTKITNLIRYGKTTLTNNDDRRYPYTQITYNGKVTEAMTLSPYGLYSQAPLNSLAIVWQAFGQEENLAAMCFDPTNRFNNLKPGEVVIGNQVTQSYMKFSNTNELDIVSTGDLKLNVTGKVTINCNNSEVEVNAQAVTLNSDLIVHGVSHLGEGGALIARKGDPVQVNLTTGQGFIMDGSPAGNTST